MERQKIDWGGFTPMTHHRDEERYFFEQDLELVRELRKKADHQRRQRELAHREAGHWMHCPNCGGKLEQRRVSALKLDRCVQCQGVYLAAEELELLRRLELEGEQGAGDFLGKLISELARS